MSTSSASDAATCVGLGATVMRGVGGTGVACGGAGVVGGGLGVRDGDGDGLGDGASDGLAICDPFAARPLGVAPDDPQPARQAATMTIAAVIVPLVPTPSPPAPAAL